VQYNYDNTNNLSKPESPKVDLIRFQFGYCNVACVNLCMKQQHFTESSARPHCFYTTSKPHRALQPSKHTLNNCMHNYIKHLASNVIIIPDH